MFYGIVQLQGMYGVLVAGTKNMAVRLMIFGLWLKLHSLLDRGGYGGEETWLLMETF